MESVSVGSRVKAHISTPYINADGRGLRPLESTPPRVTDRPTSESHMPPAAQQLLVAIDTNDAGNELAVARAEELERRLAAIEAHIGARNDQYLIRDALSSSASIVAIADQRQARREAARRERQRQLDDAYTDRLSSDLATWKFNSLSRETALASLRDDEEASLKQFHGLLARRRAIDRASDIAKAEARARDARAEGRAAEVREAHRREAEAKELREAQATQAAELARSAETRRREWALRKERGARREEQEMARAAWQAKSERLLKAEQEVAAMASSKERALHALVQHHRECSVQTHLTTLESLEAQFVRHAAEIRALLDDIRHPPKSALETVHRHALQEGAEQQQLTGAPSTTRCARRMGLELLVSAQPSLCTEPRTLTQEATGFFVSVADAASQCPEPSSVRRRR